MLPSPYSALRSADGRCIRMRVFWEAGQIASVELTGAEDNESAKRAAAEWATRFRGVFTHLVLDELDIELRSGRIVPEAQDETAPEPAFRTYEHHIFEDYLWLFDSVFHGWECFLHVAEFGRRPKGVVPGVGESRLSRERDATRMLRSWLRGVERFAMTTTIRNLSAHERLELARLARQK